MRYNPVLPWISSCVLGFVAKVWIFAAFQTRVAIPLRLNYPGTYTTQGRNAPGAYLPPPKDIRELEARRRTWYAVGTHVACHVNVA